MYLIKQLVSCRVFKRVLLLSTSSPTQLAGERAHGIMLLLRFGNNCQWGSRCVPKADVQVHLLLYVYFYLCVYTAYVNKNILIVIENNL